MTAEETRFGGQTFSFDKEEKEWTLTIKRSDVATQSMEELVLLDIDHPLILPQVSDWDKESVTFTYRTESNGIRFEALKERLLSEKLRIALNVVDLEDCLDLDITFFLDPVNLFFTKNGMAKLAYRALPEIMKPESLTPADFLRQLKCFILAVFTKGEFEELYKGALEVVEVPDFLKEVLEAEDTETIRERLTVSYEEALKSESAKLSQISLRQHRLFKYMAIWFSAFSAILLIPLIYMFFLQLPFQQKMLDADRDFLRVDYSGVISTLESVDIEKIPYTQKYELAYSYIRGLDFSKEQRTAILNNISLKTDELLLDYWIEVGRDHNDEAMDLSKRLEDYDLIIYAIAQKIEEVKNDTSLSGNKREEQLESLRSDYKTYNEDRQAALNGETDKSDSSSATSSSSK